MADGFVDGDGEIARVPELMYMPRCIQIGSYGGGDALQLARPMFIRRRPSSLLSDEIKEAARVAGVKALAAYRAEGVDDRVARIDLTAVKDDLADLSWEYVFQLSSQVYGEDSCNLFMQGWLFGDSVREPGRLGASKWPLVGMWQPRGVDNVGGFDGFVSFDALSPIDQHVHLVDIDDSWHVGSDMAKFAINQAAAVNSCIAVAIDAEAGRAQAAFILIIRPDCEEAVERLLRETSDGTDLPALSAGLFEALPEVDDEELKAAVKAVLESEA
eukprot:PLAT2834.1.p1 GENE.PLAT2834.1~~PLAT2834.1.p1  ORF type:complete len:272 (-),score=138.18 PLAT2834.1:98-913(-)